MKVNYQTKRVFRPWLVSESVPTKLYTKLFLSPLYIYLSNIKKKTLLQTSDPLPLLLMKAIKTVMYLNMDKLCTVLQIVYGQFWANREMHISIIFGPKYLPHIKLHNTYIFFRFDKKKIPISLQSWCKTSHTPICYWLGGYRNMPCFKKPSMLFLKSHTLSLVLFPCIYRST